MPQKNSGSGIMCVISTTEIFNELFRERVYLDGLLAQLPDEMHRLLKKSNQNIIVSDNALTQMVEHLQQVNTATKIWLNLYHSLILLHAAIGKSTSYSINCCEENSRPATVEQPCVTSEGEITDGHCLDDSHGVPAWSLGNSGEEGWLGYKARGVNFVEQFREEFEKVKDDINDLDIVVPVAILQRADDDPHERPFLQYFLAEAKSYLTNSLDPTTFEPITCLKSCLHFVTKLRPNGLSEDFATEALFQIANIWADGIEQEDMASLLTEENSESNLTLWSERVKGRLEEVKSWGDILNMNDEAFEAWVKDTHQISLTQDQTSRDLFDVVQNSDSSNAKWIASSMASMLRFNAKTLDLIYHRCFDQDNEPPFAGLCYTIDRLIPDSINQDEWKNLRSATLSIIAWHIFHQITPTVNRIRAIVQQV